jgi:hypothetical protein
MGALKPWHLLISGCMCVVVVAVVVTVLVIVLRKK